ncbi:hypothetical protein COH20_007898 [Aspergillus flavus]|nr:hypothetical protein AFGD_006676 [Aspergillus flavus]RAQ68166.1 hypothetical protein COH20_007898 [Aspergillus flavus]
MPARIKDPGNLYESKVQPSWDVLITLEPNVLDTLEEDPLFSFLVEKKEQLIGSNLDTGVNTLKTKTLSGELPKSTYM